MHILVKALLQVYYEIIEPEEYERERCLNGFITRIKLVSLILAFDCAFGYRARVSLL